MKKLYALFILLYSSMGFSQSSELLNEIWYLEKLIIDGVNSFPPVNATLPYVPLQFSENNVLQTSVCNIGFGEISLTEENIFSLDYFSVTLIVCQDQSNNIFESDYLQSYFQYNIPGAFLYAVIVGENGVKQLTITNPQNNQAVYYNQVLKNPSFEKSNWSFYPNPTKDILYFKNETFTKSHIEIYDVLGKLCRSKTLDLNSQSIDTANLEKGVYVIKIFNDKEFFSGKFIKE